MAPAHDKKDWPPVQTTAMRMLCLTMWITALVSAAAAQPARQWPDVLVIDEFAAGLENWENDDTGKLSLADGPRAGTKALLWTSTDDSTGQIIFKKLSKEAIDVSHYDLLLFDIKVAGRPIWNINPIVQQYPAAYGFRGQYYSVDTMHPFGAWFTYSQDLTRWENAWPDSFDTQKQEFRFEVLQLAGAGNTQLHLANIRLVKNPLGLKNSYPGTWGLLADGTQITQFALTLANRRDRPLTVRLAVDADDRGSLSRFQADVPGGPIRLLPGESRTVNVSVSVSAESLKSVSPWYGETARIAARIDEIPELVLHTELVAGTKPAGGDVHPRILCNAARMREIQTQYADPAKRATLAPELLAMVAAGEAALAYEPEYPPSAAEGRTTDPVSGGGLQRIDVPNLPFDVYQDPKSGRTYSGPLYDAGMKGWRDRHMANADKAKTLGIASLVSGRREFAVAAARILRAYVDVYPTLPITNTPPGSPVASASSGSVRIGGTYMRERIWLGDLAIALDAIRPADVLGDAEVRAIAEQIFVPSAMNMMDHKVGVMNLQMQLQSAALYAGLAADDPGLVARAVYDSHGIMRLIDIGYLPDGSWWEDPSYQTVMNMIAYPVMAVCLRSGILPADKRLADILTAFYGLPGPTNFTPSLGTGVGRTSSLNDTAAHLFAPLLDDPRIAWLAANRRPSTADSGETYSMAIIGGGTSKVPAEKAVSPIPAGTVDLADYGGIAMRLPGTDAYCYMQYGREVTHGHRNKLSLNAYGKGGWYIRNVAGGYESNFQNFLETIASSSSIMVDGRNARSDTGTLLHKKSLDGIEIASGRENQAWPDVEHRRTVVLTRGPLIVIDRCRAGDDREHTYDWLYQSNMCGLSLDTKEPVPAGPERLGDTPYYSGLHPAGRFAAVGEVAWKRTDGSGMRMTLLPRGELFLTDVKDTYYPSQGLVWRQRGKTCHFAAVYWPYRKDEAGKPGLEELKVEGDGVAYRVTAPEGVYTVLVNDGDTPLTAAGVTTADVTVTATPP